MSSTTAVEEPINVRIKSARRATIGDLRLKPRQYQTELCNQALSKNVIIYLGTGLGKTYITVLYLINPLVAAQISDNKKVVFLAPTQDLVKQQALYIHSHTNYSAKIFCGRNARCGEHIDHWDKATWAEEIAKVDLLFMTPQIFSAAISTNILDWSQFGTIIFDEVHHACRTKKQATKHPYGQIIGHYGSYFSNRANPPRLIGLTASLINSMPKDREHIVGAVKYLENILEAKCVTDIKVQDKRPQMVSSSYDCTDISPNCDTLTSVLRRLKIRIEESLKLNDQPSLLRTKYLTPEQAKALAFINRLKLATIGISIKPGSFSKVLDGMINIRNNCGLWTLKAVCLRIVEALEKPHIQTFLSPGIQAVYKDFSNILRLFYKTVEDFLGDDVEKQLLTYTRPKVKALLKTLKDEYLSVKNGTSDKSSFSCIIFVRSRLEVVALNLLMQRISTLPEYNFIKCDYALGLAACSSSKYACITKRTAVEQQQTLTNFRKGDKNVIITTSVLEEGIDLPVCSTVIRYDLAGNFREYVQSRGRARQEISSYISMCETKDLLANEKNLDKFCDFEQTLKRVLGDYNIGVSMANPRNCYSSSANHEDEEDFFETKGGALRISSTTARTIISMYCNQLSKNTPFLEGVTYSTVQPSRDTYLVTIYLPSGCPLPADGITGRPKSSEYLAENSAAVAAVEALYNAKELDDHAVPMRCNEKNADHLLESLGLAPNYDPLEERFEGRKLIDDEGESKYFTTMSSHPMDYLSKDCANRTYKLLKIRFVAQEGGTRVETCGYFEKCTYGMIIDSTTSTEFIPNTLYSHYGTFRVDYQIINDNLGIKERFEHNQFLDYTHRLITRCLSLGPIKSQDFSRRCLFYLVALNHNDQIDINKMSEAFQQPVRCELKSNDIVRLNYHYRNNNQSRSANCLMLVKRVRYDLGPDTLIPGRKRETLLEAAEASFGRGAVTNMRQPIIEVVPLSSDFASTRPRKKIREDHSTQSRFYFDQFLERFDQDPASVLQAFNLPEIINQLYIITSLSTFDKKFLKDTKSLRAEPSVASSGNVEQPTSNETNTEAVESAILNDPNELVSFEASGDEVNSGHELDKENFEAGEGEDDDEEDEEECSDEDYPEEEDTYYGSSSDEGELVGTDYRELLQKKTLNMNDNEREEDFKAGKWDMSQYKVDNLAKQDHKHLHFSEQENVIADDVNYSKSIMKLWSSIEPLEAQLCHKLKDIELIMTSDATFVNEEEEFKKRTAKVDRSIIPPIKFDRVKGPLREESRERALMEALTLRRAGQSINLEGLENVGDSYLKYLTSVVLFKSTDGNEGLLTRARSQLVCNRHFTHLAKRKQLGSFAITRSFSKDELAHMLGRPIRENSDPKLFDNRLKPKDLADLFEAVIGSHLVYGGEFDALLAVEWLGIKVISREPALFDEVHQQAVVFSRVPPGSLFADSSSNEDARLYLESFKKKVRSFEDIIGYKFNDPSYLVQAFTHATSSKKATRSYERLEFLGDAILDFLVTTHLSQTKIANDPGQLTSSRSALVCNEAFAKLSLTYKYDLFIQHSSLELYDELTKTRLAMEDQPDMSFISMTNFDKVVKVLGDVFESVAGAIYCDSGMSLDTVWATYYPMMKGAIDKELGEPSKNPIAALYEMFPGRGRITFDTYDLKIEDDGDSVGVRCKVVGFGEFEGKGMTRRQAKLRSVQEALRNPPSEEMRARLYKDFLDSERIAGRGNPQRGAIRGRGRGRARGRGGAGGRGSWRGSRNAYPHRR